jgi:hypothetical protein
LAEINPELLCASFLSLLSDHLRRLHVHPFGSRSLITKLDCPAPACPDHQDDPTNVWEEIFALEVLGLIIWTTLYSRRASHGTGLGCGVRQALKTFDEISSRSLTSSLATDSRERLFLLSPAAEKTEEEVKITLEADRDETTNLRTSLRERERREEMSQDQERREERTFVKFNSKSLLLRQ